MATAPPTITITPLSPTSPPSKSTFTSLYSITASAFGAQTNDLIWKSFNPNWDTPEGVAAGAERLQRRVVGAKRDREGRGCCVVVMATVGSSSSTSLDGENDGEDDGKTIVGVAIWVQLSARDGFGDPVPRAGAGFEERRDDMGLQALWPGDEERQRWLVDVDRGLHGMRWEVVRGKKDDDVPAAWVLDLCAVRPEWQGKGVAGRLVQWGVEEAERRGGLECLTEASRMGRGVYMKYGFGEVGEIEYGLGQGVEGDCFGELPSNVFMRTGEGS